MSILNPRSSTRGLAGWRTLFLIFLLLVWCDLAPAQNLVSNGTFNVASTAGWQPAGCCGGYVNEGGSAQGGVGDWLSIGSSLSQTLNTVPGQRYLLSFATRGDNPGQSYRMATMRISWGGQLIGSYTSPNNGVWLYPKFLLDATGPTELRFATAVVPQLTELDDVVVVPAPATQPDVVLTSPGQGAVYVMGDTVPLSVSVAAGPGRSIRRVDYFHSGTTSIVSAASAPYNAAWTNVPPGTWYISARVMDSASAITTAVLKQITVVTRPTVYWVLPAEGAVVAIGDNVPLSAVVTNNDGRITSLTFRAEGNVVTNFSSPASNGTYFATWGNVPRGNFTLEATGYDSNHVAFSSALRNVSVLPMEVIDQQQYEFSSTVWAQPGTSYAQTFTPAIDGELHHIELQVFPNHFAEVYPVNITVVETMAGAPTGRVLGQTVIPNVEQTGDPKSAYFRTASPVLRAGVLYAFIVGPTFQTNGLTIRTAYTDDPYKRGAIWRQAGAGPWEQAEREPNLYADMVFATYMAPRAAPLVSISSPTAGGHFRAGDSIPLSAIATDPDSMKVSVRFFAGGIAIGAVANPPYELLWENIPAGGFPLTAIATDELGLSRRSASVLIDVQPTNTLPLVSVLDATIVEGARTNLLIVPLVLSAAATNDVTVQYATADGTAGAGLDYEAVSGVAIFRAGVTNTTISVPIYGDQIDEPHEYLAVNLLSASGANLNRVQAIGTILDDEFGRGKVHHFSFGDVPSPQTTNRPFFVSISALDVFNGVATNFSGAVGLSLLRAPTDLGNTLLDGVLHTTTINPETTVTIGYAFTPSTNLLVTGVRHYAGYYMSLWTDDGMLLFKHELPRIASWWVDSTLAAPVALKAGKTYRIAFFTGGLTWYGIPTRPTNFLHGTFGPAFQRTGEGFPDGGSPPAWPLADLRYHIDTPLDAQVMPESVKQFVNGRWSGALRFDSLPVASMQLRAEDSFGHIGLSRVFNMNRAPMVEITSPASNAVIYPPANLPITATASDPDGNIARVEFSRDGELLGVLPSGPFTWTWSDVPPGEHTIMVRAIDDLGAALSASTSVRVLAPYRSIATLRFDPPAIPGGSRFISQWNEHGFTFDSENMSHTDSGLGGRPQGAGAFLQTTHVVMTGDDQRPFSLISADLAEYSTLFQNPLEVTIQGWRVDGFVVTHTFTTDGTIDGIGVLDDFEHFVFPPEFSFLFRAEMSSPFPAFSLENLRVAADFSNAPQVRISSPLNGRGFATADLAFEASVLTSTGNVTRVDFAVDGDFVGSAFAPSFRLPWPFLTFGTHAVIATAFDNFGIEVGSDPVVFEVTAKPLVAITMPTNGTVVVVGEPVTLQASAADEDGTVAQVTFFDGTNVLGSVTNTPFWMTWSNFPAGLHSLSAIAADNFGVIGTSVVVQVIGNIPPSVSLNSPSNQVVLQPGDLIHFSADAHDVDGTITFVEFYLGTNLVGRILSPPYEMDWISTGTGPFCARAVAVDKQGAARSDRMSGRVNQRPMTAILVPAIQAAFIAPAVIEISGFAEDLDGTVSTIFVSAGSDFTVRFDTEEQKMPMLVDCESMGPGTSQKLPFTCVWSNVPSGIHIIRAYAVDSDGASSAIAETTVFDFNYPPMTAEWVATNVVRRPSPIRFVQRVGVSNPTANTLLGGELLVHLDRPAILRGVRVIGGTRVRRGVFSVPVPSILPLGTATVEIQYAAPNRRRIPETLILPIVR
jgi:hypothetical protein